MIPTINIGYYEVRTTAQCDKVTVFTHSMPEKGMKHNDVYVDDAELVVIDASGVVIPQSASRRRNRRAPAAIGGRQFCAGADRFTAARWRTGACGESGRYDLRSVTAIQSADGSDFAVERLDQRFIDSHRTGTGDCWCGGRLRRRLYPQRPDRSRASAAPTATSIPATAVAMKEPSGKTQSVCARL